MSLVIRNLTSTALDLKRLERFEQSSASAPIECKDGLFGSIGSFIRTFFNLLHFSTASSTTGEPSEGATKTEDKDCDIHIKAFSTYQTEVEPPGDNLLRLIFENDGQKYRIDIPVQTSRSATMTGITQDAKHEYTCIYSQEYQHLTILSSSKLNRWMGELRDETLLTELSIPGTHNSPTCHRALPSVRCQAASPLEQLENGVRFFDVRVQVERPGDASKDGLIMVHSVFPISLTGTKYFRDLSNEIQDFLARNPSETVIISLKREGTGDGTDHQLANIVRNHYANDASIWHTNPRLPTLGEVRRKIVLLRRFGIDKALNAEHGGKGWGVNAETWADNTPHALSPSGELCVQDFYEVLHTQNIDEKIKYSTEQLARAAETIGPAPGLLYAEQVKKQPLFINFLSASNFWKVDCWPERIAAKLNPAVVDYLCRMHNEPAEGKNLGDGGTGIVVCDWVGNDGDWDLVRAIIGMNAKLLLK